MVTTAASSSPSGPISLSTVYADTNIVLADLSDFDRQTVEATIWPARSPMRS